MPDSLDNSIVILRLAYLDRRDPRRKIFGGNRHDYKFCTKPASCDGNTAKNSLPDITP